MTLRDLKSRARGFRGNLGLCQILRSASTNGRKQRRKHRNSEKNDVCRRAVRRTVDRSATVAVAGTFAGTEETVAPWVPRGIQQALGPSHEMRGTGLKIRRRTGFEGQRQVNRE